MNMVHREKNGSEVLILKKLSIWQANFSAIGPILFVFAFTHPQSI